MRKTNGILFLLITSFFMGLVGCGVKGQPEPPYPTEATTKKAETEVNTPAGTPAPVPFANSALDKSADTKTVPKAKNKKKKSQ